jgi:hypothetical protein
MEDTADGGGLCGRFWDMVVDVIELGRPTLMRRATDVVVDDGSMRVDPGVSVGYGRYYD